MDDPVDNKPPSFWQMLHSVMAAAFGVQSGKFLEAGVTRLEERVYRVYSR